MAREPIPEKRDHPVRCIRYGHPSTQKVRMLGHEVGEGGLGVIKWTVAKGGTEGLTCPEPGCGSPVVPEEGYHGPMG
jgi:hypothetical protein